MCAGCRVGLDYMYYIVMVERQMWTPFCRAGCRDSDGASKMGPTATLCRVVRGWPACRTVEWSTIIRTLVAAADIAAAMVYSRGLVKQVARVLGDIPV